MVITSNNSRLLTNRYQLVELIGSGAMGQVYRAEDTLLGGVTVAVKFLAQTLLNQKMRQRFEQEATVSALLGEKSIHIVRVRDYGVDENQIPFYVMEFLEGESLEDLLEFRPLSLPRFFKLAQQICWGLESAHQGIVFKQQRCSIVHRDVKPSNIFITKDPSFGELVKVLDFGVARLVQTDSVQTGSFMGTLAYCSPEQMEGKELDHRSDIYSFGVMMYEMLTNEMPIIPETSSFGGWYTAHHKLKPKIFNSSFNLPKQLEALVMQCLAKSPSDRPQSINQVLSALEAIEQSCFSSAPTSRANEATVATVTEKSPQKSGHLVKQPIKTSTVASTPNDICLNTVWPEDKPHQKIVFPRLITTPQENLVSLWAMLEDQEIVNRINSTRYNQFLFLKSPHPMLLWITVLFNRSCGFRWLPCYLDLKTSLGQATARALGKSGTYRLLFFALEDPQRPKNMLNLTIATTQRKYLIDWANIGQLDSRSQDSRLSKRLLKQEYEKLRPKIMLKLESIYSDHPKDISG